MSEGYRIAHISELQIGTGGGKQWAPVRHELEINAFGVNAWTVEQPGQDVIGEHDEVGARAGHHEELYFVVSGSAVFTVNGEEIDAPAGTFVFVRDPAAKRKAVATEAGTTVLVAGGPKGKAFEPAQWERSAQALRHWETKDWDAAIADLSKLHAEDPKDAGILYNRACAKSLAGLRDEALEDLAKSLELDATFAKLAQSDSDFDAIRDAPEFSALAGKADAGCSDS